LPPYRTKRWDCQNVIRLYAACYDPFFFSSALIAAELASVGLTDVKVIERDPYLDVEYPSRRAYVLARKPD